MLGARNRISLNLIQYPSSDDLDDITSSSLSNLRYCTLVRMIYTGLNLATHRIVPVPWEQMELHRVVLFPFSSNRMVLFIILPELQAISPILLSIVQLLCTI